MPSKLPLSLLSTALILSLAAPAFSQTTTFAPAQQAAPQANPATTPAQTPDAASVKPKKTFSLNAQEKSLKLTDDIAIAEAQLQENPDDPEAHFLLGAAYSRTPYLEKAFKHIKKTKELLKAKKDFEFIDRTVQEYEKLTQEKPNDTVILYRLALGYYFKAYSLEKYPHHYKETPTGTAEAFYQKAKDTMSRVIALDPKDIWARDYLGIIVSENGKDLTKAIGIWQESLAVDSQNNPGAYLLLSQAYLKQGDLQNALLYGAKGLEIKQRMGMTLP